MQKVVPTYSGTLRSHSLEVPDCIAECSGIRIFGRRIKSLVFSTDVAIIKNVNADAIIAVYPFTPQPSIAQAIINVSDVPVLVGVGGGMTNGPRSVRLAAYAEHQGAFGVVVNAPITDQTIFQIKAVVDIPVIATIVSARMDVAKRIACGADILNVSGAAETPAIVRQIREKFPDIPIIATGGPTDATILETIQAGANAITYTPPTNGELFAASMRRYRSTYAEEEETK
ncbi:MAG: hydrolase [Oscillospiraceae bacterium]|jgi:2-keto-3-deoxy-6-phosphogluconate aldolase|nr:hydrolase [Oscillospiraceae bacterium]MCI8716275.1 hydrolase [Oscillospiraceae bacterium]MCI9317583.1 hydrolase [Oscillospiraceae bacterium]MDE6936083.1 hydrolase [Oscillospiraceae bacterium]